MDRRSFMSTVGLGALAFAVPSGAAESKSSKPNILLVMADDMGYSDAGCFGGDIDTRNLDALAAGGVRFTQHYSTGRCWPSRACILTGYYAQHIRRDGLPGLKGGHGKRPAWAPLLPELLRPLGYRSYHSGKWHVDGKPTGNGFDRSWGSHGGGCDWDRFFSSGRWEEDGIKAPVKRGEPYYSTVAIADHAIQCLKLHKQNHGDTPFFQYVAFYSPHFPLHALHKDIDSYRDTYIEGWDVVRSRRLAHMKEMGLLTCGLSPRHEKIVPSWNLKPQQLQQQIGDGEAAHAVAWDTLTESQKRFQATKMAIHAAMIHRMDSELGRIVAQLKEMGAFDNTVIVFVSDNGASAEQIIRGDGHDKSASPGSAKSYLCLGPGWSTAANTPFRLHKHWNHEGGISSPCVVHWPKGISEKGAVRHSPSHFIDFVPTALELAGGELPETRRGLRVPLKPGVSLVPALAGKGGNDERTLWWCHSGNRAIRVGDWKLSMRSGNNRRWELYNLRNDRSELNDLSAERPDKVKELAAAWNSIAQGFRKDLKTAR